MLQVQDCMPRRSAIHLGCFHPPDGSCRRVFSVSSDWEKHVMSGIVYVIEDKDNVPSGKLT